MFAKIFVPNHQYLEATQMSYSRWADTLGHLDTGILGHAKQNWAVQPWKALEELNIYD